MLLRFKLRLGALVLLVGAGLAVVGELFTLWNTNPLTGGWFVSMGLITLGTLAVLYGINTYAQFSRPWHRQSRDRKRFFSDSHNESALKVRSDLL